MESEGPYSYSSVAGKIVEDAKDGSMAQAMITKALKDAHAEGRKSAEKEMSDRMGLDYVVRSSTKLGVFAKMEKDFRELLELANRIEEFYPGRYEHVERFKSWKKSRGIK